VVGLGCCAVVRVLGDGKLVENTFEGFWIGVLDTVSVHFGLVKIRPR